MSSFTSRLDGALNRHESKDFAPTQVFLSVVTGISITSIILETVQSLHHWHSLFLTIEWISVTIFSLEYLARLGVSQRKLRYIFSFWGLVDAISILPTFLSSGNFTFLKSFRDLRILRMMRILRLAKISRAYLGSHDEAKTQAEFNKMNLVIYFMSLFSMTIIFAALLYAVEHAQHAYSNIPLAMVQSAKILVGGLGQAATPTLAGEIIVIIGRFVGLALFGLLISIVGGVLNQLLFGKVEKK